MPVIDHCTVPITIKAAVKSKDNGCHFSHRSVDKL